MERKTGKTAPRQVVITIAPDGATSIEAVGFQGNACKEATRPYINALGGIASEIEKPEMRLPPVATRTDQTVKRGE